MTKIIFATHNEHKIDELRSLLVSQDIKFISLRELNYHSEIEETGDTLAENAIIKARTIYNKYSATTISEDTGLEVNALDNRPGVYTARYAGDAKDPEANMQKILDELKDQDDRKAQFRTVIALVSSEGEFLFEGICKGEIAQSKKGQKGFGYDPIFIPEGFDDSFAQLGMQIKNKISHRARAMRKLMTFLNEE